MKNNRIKKCNHNKYIHRLKRHIESWSRRHKLRMLKAFMIGEDLYTGGFISSRVKIVV